MQDDSIRQKTVSENTYTRKMKEAFMEKQLEQIHLIA